MGKKVAIVALGVLDEEVFAKAKSDGIFADNLVQDGLFFSVGSPEADIGLFSEELVENTAIPHLRRCLGGSLLRRCNADS